MSERYRVEDGVHSIDVRLATVEQMFDNRDPAPFRERDLDPDLVEYLMGAGEDLLGDQRVRVEFWLEKPCSAGEVEAAFRAHFAYELERLERRARGRRRVTNVTLAVGVALLVVFLTLAQIAERAIPGSAGATLHEGLTLLSWIVMWRPVEALLYDWLPVRRQRRVLEWLGNASIVVHTGARAAAT